MYVILRRCPKKKTTQTPAKSEGAFFIFFVSYWLRKCTGRKAFYMFSHGLQSFSRRASHLNPTTTLPLTYVREFLHDSDDHVIL
jgi:hypothetical protein